MLQPRPPLYPEPVVDVIVGEVKLRGPVFQLKGENKPDYCTFNGGNQRSNKLVLLLGFAPAYLDKCVNGKE